MIFIFFLILALKMFGSMGEVGIHCGLDGLGQPELTSSKVSPCRSKKNDRAFPLARFCAGCGSQTQYKTCQRVHTSEPEKMVLSWN